MTSQAIPKTTSITPSSSICIRTAPAAALADRFEREVLAIDRVISCHNVSGTADYLLQIAAAGLDEYGDFMRDVLRTLPGMTSVESMLSLREVKPDSGLPAY